MIDVAFTQSLTSMKPMHILSADLSARTEFDKYLKIRCACTFTCTVQVQRLTVTTFSPASVTFEFECNDGVHVVGLLYRTRSQRADDDGDKHIQQEEY